MTATDQMRAMLDQLMGTARNGEWEHPVPLLSGSLWYLLSIFLLYLIPVHCLSLSGENKNTMKFSDGKVCKSFLIGCCPHDILASTVSAVHGRPPLYLVVITIHKRILRLYYSPDVGHIELLLCTLMRSSSGCYQYRTAINSGHPLLY